MWIGDISIELFHDNFQLLSDIYNGAPLRTFADILLRPYKAKMKTSGADSKYELNFVSN